MRSIAIEEGMYSGLDESIDRYRCPEKYTQARGKAHK
jgi:hypothetical protein